MEWKLSAEVGDNLPGDKIQLPVECLNDLLQRRSILDSDDAEDDKSEIYTFKLVAGSGAVVYAGVSQFTADDKHVKLSAFLCHALGFDVLEDKAISVTLVKLERGVFARFKTRDSTYLKLNDVRAVLERTLRQSFTTLTRGCSVAVKTPALTCEFEVEMLVAEGGDSEDGVDAVIIIDTDLSVDIVPVVSSVDAQAKPIALSDPLTVNGPAVTLSLDGSTPIFFKIAIPDDVQGAFQLRAITSDLNLCMLASILTENPTVIDHEWEALHVIDGKLVITVTDVDRPITAAAPEGFLYVSYWCHGAKSGYKSTFQCLVTRTNLESTTVTPTFINDDTAETKTCPNCKAGILITSFMRHEAFCLRNNACCNRCQKVMKNTDMVNHWHCPDCDFIGTKSDQEKHQALVHTEITCPCGVSLPLRALKFHRVTNCPERLIICRYCHTLVQSGPPSSSSKDLLIIGPRISEHESQCGSRTIQCAVCMRSVQIRDVAVHMKIHDHERRNLPLPFKKCSNVNCTHPIDAQNNMSLCSKCFSPFWSGVHDPEQKKRFQRIVQVYFQQFTVGCGLASCRNLKCKSFVLSDVENDKSPNDHAFESLELVKVGNQIPPRFYFCVDDKTTEMMKLAQSLMGLDYPIEWCIHALKTVKEAKKKSINARKVQEDDDDAESPPYSSKELMNDAVNFLLSNAPAPTQI